MKKYLSSFILLFILTLMTFSIPTAAEETAKPAQNIDDKSIALNKKGKEHNRFKEENAAKATTAAASDNVKRTVNVEATAYTAFCEGCSGTTYTGIDLRANPKKKVIAVDPNVIPLGSRVRVPGYGVAIAGDIGGDINGHRIDVFLADQSDALDFGRRQIKVEILES